MDHSGLIEFIDDAITSTRAAERIAAILDDRGFSRVRENGAAPRPSDTTGLYLRTGGSVIAIAPGREDPQESGVLILAAHTDSPGLRIKHRGATWSDRFIRVPVEVYGSPILAGWIDRELAIVGRIARTGPDGIVVTEIDGRRPVAIIPNLAIHYNRTVNENLSYDKHEHIQVLVDPGRNADTAESATKRLFSVVVPDIPNDDIVDADLAVVPAQGAVRVGDQMLSSDRLDNLIGCYSNLDAILSAEAIQTTTVMVWVDHEEIGSVSSVGAAGSWIENNLRRLLGAVGVPADRWDDTIRRSLLLSNDAAHGRHPNYADKHDSAYAPVPGGGPVIKQSAAMRYASSLPIRAWLATVGRTGGVPIQYLQNRADIPAGSTIGPAIASRLAIPSVDLGIPLLAMHSSRETIFLDDVRTMATLLSGVIERGIDEVSHAHSAR